MDYEKINKELDEYLRNNKIDFTEKPTSNNNLKFKKYNYFKSEIIINLKYILLFIFIFMFIFYIIIFSLF